jgi:hypothetical protein
MQDDIRLVARKRGTGFEADEFLALSILDKVLYSCKATLG